MKKKKYVYFFGAGEAEGTADMKQLLGGKGANLADMTSIGLPVPPGFTITTEACAFFDKHNGAYPAGMREEVLENLVGKLNVSSEQLYNRATKEMDKEELQQRIQSLRKLPNLFGWNKILSAN